MSRSPRLVLLLAVFVALAIPFQAGAWPHPDIQVEPLSVDFGDVAVGDSAFAPVAIANVGGHPLTIQLIVKAAGGSDDMDVTDVPSVPFDIFPGESVGVQVGFVPTVLGAASAVIKILSNDPDEGTVEVALAGVGISASITIQDLLHFFDKSVEGGAIDGWGRWNWVRQVKRRIFRRLLARAGWFYDRDRMLSACHVLNKALLRSDEAPHPRDLIVGEAVQELNDKIVWLMNDWGCE